MCVCVRRFGLELERANVRVVVRRFRLGLELERAQERVSVRRMRLV